MQLYIIAIFHDMDEKRENVDYTVTNRIFLHQYSVSPLKAIDEISCTSKIKGKQNWIAADKLLCEQQKLNSM